MEKSKLKNIVVLKNLPSNLVEEAFIVLKSNKKIKKFAKVEKKNGVEKTKNDSKENEYIIKEAEMLVEEYLSKLEKNNKPIKIKNTDNKKYRRLKRYSYFISLIALMETISLIII